MSAAIMNGAQRYCPMPSDLRPQPKVFEAAVYGMIVAAAI